MLFKSVVTTLGQSLDGYIFSPYVPMKSSETGIGQGGVLGETPGLDIPIKQQPHQRVDAAIESYRPTAFHRQAR